MTSDREARQAGQVLDGLGAMAAPQIQQRMVTAVPVGWSLRSFKGWIGCEDISMVMLG